MLNYNGYIWAYNSPFMYSKIFRNNCRFDENADIVEPLKCLKLNLTIFPTNKAYAVGWRECKDFFKPRKTKAVMKTIENSYFIHLYEHITKSLKLETNSSTAAYMKIAKKFCPSVLRNGGKYF